MKHKDAIAILADGITVINNWTEGDIEDRIEFLEEAISTYKAILNLKRMIKRKPDDLEIPFEEFISNEKRINAGSQTEQIYKYLKPFAENGNNVDAISQNTNVGINTLRCLLSRRVDLFEWVTTKTYRVRNNALHDTTVESGSTPVGNPTLQS